MKTVATIAGFFFLLILISSASAAGPGFSGVTANADSAETAATNPAGMTRIKKPSIYGNPMILYTKSETEINASDTGAKNTISDDGWVALPGLYYVHPLDDRWVIGIGPNGAAGLGATYDDEWAGRYLIEEWSLMFAGVAPAVAYRLNDKLSLGASVPIMYSQYELKKAVYNLDPDAEDGSFKLDMDGWGVGGTFSMLYELTDCTRLGVVYRSKVSVTDEGEPEFSSLTPDREDLLNKFGILDQDISLDTSTPQGVSMGVFHDFLNGWSVSLDAAWVDFSQWGVENVTIGDSQISTTPGNYKDVYAASLGINRQLTEKWTARSGFFYVSSALDDEDRTAATRFDQMWGAGLGLEYQLTNSRRVAFDVTYMQFGDGEFTETNVPLAGTVTGEYTTNYGIVFGISTQW